LTKLPIEIIFARQSGEKPEERWSPVQSVRSILLSVISLLNEPNTFSPANVDASVMYRRWKESGGKDKEYENIIRKQVTASRLEAEKEGVHVPTTIEEYCIKHKKPTPADTFDSDMADFYDDDFGDDMEDDEEDEDYQDDNEDSGNGES